MNYQTWLDTYFIPFYLNEAPSIFLCHAIEKYATVRKNKGVYLKRIEHEIAQVLARETSGVITGQLLRAYGHGHADQTFPELFKKYSAISKNPLGFDRLARIKWLISQNFGKGVA